MTPKAFNIAVGEAANYTDEDAYVSDLALSSIWSDGSGDEADVTDEEIARRAEELRRAWKIARLDVREIRRHTGLTQVAFGERFLIPARTIGNWETGDRECPLYTRYLLALATGYIK